MINREGIAKQCTKRLKSLSIYQEGASVTPVPCRHSPDCIVLHLCSGDGSDRGAFCRRNADPSRICRRGKRKLTESAKEFPKDSLMQIPKGSFREAPTRRDLIHPPRPPCPPVLSYGIIALLETGMAHLLEYVGSVHIYLGPYRGNPISLYLKRTEAGCQIGPKAYPWNDVVGNGETPNKAAADFEEKWKSKGLSPEMYSGPSWEGDIKPEKPAPPKPSAPAKPTAPAPASVPAGQSAVPATKAAAPADGTPTPAPALVAPPGDESS